MCGIVGYIGNRSAEPILLQGLRKLEYRGYDSAGVAVCSANGMQVRKSEGKLDALEQLLRRKPCSGSVGIGHTRWATHGRPCDANAHPHTDGKARFAVVHNGIVENHEQLRERLISKGYTFVSETDSEVIAHLIADVYKGDLAAAVRKATQMLTGSFALLALSALEPDKLVAARRSSPLVIGLGEGEQFVGSDISAVLDHTRNVIILEDGETAVIARDHVEVFDEDGLSVGKEVSYVIWDAVQAEKGGFDHYMLKEIYEQPRAYRDTMRSRLNGRNGKTIDLAELKMSAAEIGEIERIQLVACGTAYHAALVGKFALEALTRIPTEAEIASEYRYRNPIVSPRTLVVAVSQSGETADTLAAVREARRRGARILAVTNVVGSSLAREADATLYTWAGPEISVASTKAYTTQLLALYLLALYFAQELGTQNRILLRRWANALRELPDKAEQILGRANDIRRFAEQLAENRHVFFIGRGFDFAAALEGSLKLKEITYIHSEAYAAGELKHGTLALIEEGTPVIAIAVQDGVVDKTINNIKEVKARGARVYGICGGGNASLDGALDERFEVPETEELFAPALTVIPLQLLAYYTALIKGHDVDKPRNLAKSVTVE